MASKTRTCWQCGRTVPEEEAVRMTVQTGTSVGRGQRFYHGRRTLCSDCGLKQRERDRLRTISNVVILVIIVAAAIFWLVIRPLIGWQ